MITDLLLAPLLALAEWVVDSLPTGQPLNVPAIDSLWELVANVDSLFPILGPATVMLGVLSAGAVFVVVRLALTLWNLVYP